VFAGIHIEAHVGRVTLCAEAVALGTALSAGARDIETVVAVAQVRVVSPCGMCRELISDFGPDAWVILSAGASGATKVSVHDLLPAKYARREQGRVGQRVHMSGDPTPSPPRANTWRWPSTATAHLRLTP